MSLKHLTRQIEKLEKAVEPNVWELSLEELAAIITSGTQFTAQQMLAMTNQDLVENGLMSQNLLGMSQYELVQDLLR